MCTAFRGKAERRANLTVKKIPRPVLSRCEWGHDDYRLSVENLPKARPSPGQQSLFDDGGRRMTRKHTTGLQPFFPFPRQP